MTEKRNQEDLSKKAKVAKKSPEKLAKEKSASDKAAKEELEKLSGYLERLSARRKSLYEDKPPLPEDQQGISESLFAAVGVTLKELPYCDEYEMGQMLIRGAKAADSFVVNFLLMRGAEINARDGKGMTALHHAAAIGARPCIRALMKYPQCDYLVRDNQGRYPADLAIEWAEDYALARLLAWKQLKQAASLSVPAWVPA